MSFLFNSVPAQDDAFMDLLGNRDFKFAANSKASAFKDLMSLMSAIESVEGVVADARVGFVRAKDEGVKAGVSRFVSVCEDERAKMEKVEKLLVQAITICKQAKGLFN